MSADEPTGTSGFMSTELTDCAPPSIENDMAWPVARGLVADDLREVIQANASARMNQVGGQAFIPARNPAAATRARLANWQGFAPQTHSEQATRTAKIGRASRRPRVVSCEGCGVMFCPLRATKRRRFCTRSCASHTNALSRTRSR